MSKNEAYQALYQSGQRFWAIVPAAGIGARMNSDIPKQYLPLLGRTVLEHTLERLVNIDLIEGVVVCLSCQDMHWASLAISRHEKIVTVNGGAERMHSVYKALHFLQKEQGLQQEFVLVHDAVRPCVKSEDIEKLILAVVDDEVGGILATPAVDTLKRVDENNRVIETLPRESCWRAQTPQMFRLALLCKSIELLLNRNRLASDEAAAIEASGLQPLIVEGSQENIKLTLPTDLALMETLLAGQQKQQQKPVKQKIE